ncbi:MAG: acetate kinase [Candidatus Thiodiazotropha sp.]
MIILVINSGSSSVKYGIFDLTTGGEPSRGIVDLTATEHAGDRAGAIRQIFRQAKDIDGIGHRVVHGGAGFLTPMRIDPGVLERIRALNHLAPLHNPASTLGIDIALEAAPETPQVAVFDTTFFSTLPESAWRYALPKALADTHQIRRYGFHGISHEYVANEAAQHLGRAPNALRLITLHLGNGASAAAIEGGRCVETSMGMTPQEGLVMGTRAGDLDPSILIHLQRQTGMTADQLEQLLNRESGLRGLCGETDMRTIRERARHGDAQARLAIDIFVHRVRKYIGAYTAVLGGLDALVFTGGIGEHDADLRDEVCMGLSCLGIRLDAQRNASHATIISQAEQTPQVMVIPTNEELAIARATQRCLAR